MNCDGLCPLGLPLVLSAQYGHLLSDCGMQHCFLNMRIARTKSCISTNLHEEI